MSTISILKAGVPTTRQPIVLPMPSSYVRALAGQVLLPLLIICATSATPLIISDITITDGMSGVVYGPLKQVAKQAC